MVEVRKLVLKPLPQDPLVDSKTGEMNASWRVWFDDLRYIFIPQEESEEKFTPAVHGHTSEEDGGVLDLQVIVPRLGTVPQIPLISPDLWQAYHDDMFGDSYEYQQYVTYRQFQNHYLPFVVNQLISLLEEAGIIQVSRADQLTYPPGDNWVLSRTATEKDYPRYAFDGYADGI